MNLYKAGSSFGDRDFVKVGKAVIYRTLKAQNPEVFWPEHGESTTHYNLVYIHALGLYYDFSKDRNILPYLKNALRFQIMFTYSDGVQVETVDGRVKYKPAISPLGLAAFTLFLKAEDLHAF